MAKLFVYCIIIQFFSMIYCIGSRCRCGPKIVRSLMLDRQTLRVWLRGANIETGGVREGGKNVSVNGILQPNACGN
jgi:hypothetical protein